MICVKTERGQGGTIMKKAESKALTAARIEDAGICVFAQKSYALITMDDIAKAAGYTKRTVYNHFPSKMALFSHIFEKKLRELYEEELRILPTCETVVSVIQEHFRVLYRFTRDNYSFMKMFWGVRDYAANSEIPETVVAHITALNRKLIDFPVDMILLKDSQKTLKNCTPELIVHYISAMNKGVFLQYDKENALSLDGPTRDQLAEFSLLCLLNHL